MENNTILINGVCFKIDDVSYRVVRDNLIEINVSFSCQGNKERFKVLSKNIKGFERAIKKVGAQKRNYELVKSVKQDLEQRLMDWVFNTSSETKPFILNKDKKEYQPPKEIKRSRKVELKPLFLVLERIYFDEIIEGTKTVEYRLRKPFYTSRLMHDGMYRNLKTVIFQEGYHKKARRIEVKIKKIVLQDEIYEIHLGEIVNRSF